MWLDRSIDFEKHYIGSEKITVTSVTSLIELKFDSILEKDNNNRDEGDDDGDDDGAVLIE